jgi:hypothetical protein
MAIFYIDLRDGRGLVPDEEGAEFDHIDAALDEARASAQDLIKQYAHDQDAVSGARVEVRDVSGRTVAAVRVRDVLAHRGTSPALNRRLHR